MGVAAPKAGMADSREEVPSVCPTSPFAPGAAPEPPEGGTPNVVDAPGANVRNEPNWAARKSRHAKQSQLGGPGIALAFFHGEKTIIPPFGWASHCAKRSQCATGQAWKGGCSWIIHERKP